MNKIAALRDALDRPELVRVFGRARDHMQRNGLTPSGSVSLPDASEAERRALARLIGSKVQTGRTLRVSLSDLDAGLRSSRFSVSLREALETLGGSLQDRRAATQQAAERRERYWAEARSHGALLRHPRLEGWLDQIRAAGTVARLGETADPNVLQRALGVLAMLPQQGARLPVLAAETLGDSHGLDPGRAEATLVLNALGFLRCAPPRSGARARRALWAYFGVACDDLSCDVLTLGVTPAEGKLADACAALARFNEPMRLTLHSLLPADLRFDHPRVFVCENPVVVAEAASLKQRDAPLVCVDGIPNTAALTLLDSLSLSGSEIHYHGDFDWGGIRVANVLADHLVVTPWRFDVRSYERSVGEMDDRLPELTGRPVAATWDAGLTESMRARGKVVLEEHVLTDLMSDLGPATP